MSAVVPDVEPGRGRIAVADRMPAHAHRPDGASVAETCRVILTRDEVYVFSDRGGRVRLEHQGPWDPDASELPRLKPWTIATPDGSWTVTRKGDCGCSSPLKRFTPWTPFRAGRL